MSLEIRFVTDYVCPYCLVAKGPLLKACEGRDIKIEWMPFELTTEPKDRVDTYNDEARKVKWEKTLMPIIKEQGLDMKVPPKVIPRPYTRLAFEGYHYAKANGRGEEYNSLMYNAYFVEEQDIGDIDVICSIGQRAGLNAEELKSSLIAGTYYDIQRECDRYAKEDLGVTSVPTIFIGDKRVDGSVYSEEEFARLIDEAMKENNETVTGYSCNENGCG